jgi:hypothetical protein
VTPSEAKDELASLEEARARLEAALAGDEHWRALQQPPAQGTQGSAAHQARNTRLKMALAENPLYQAWRHVDEAIAALRATGAAGPRPLSADIERAQQRSANAQAADSKPAQRQAGSTRQHPPAAAPSSAPPPLGIVDPEEAEVSFVRREPLLPSAKLPADLGTDRASPLFDRLRGLTEEEASAPLSEPAFLSPDDGAGEAEVTIVSSEGARLQREAEERAGTVRRLRKALSGE